MRKTSLWLAGFFCAGVVTISLSLPQCSRAGGLGQPGPNVFQHRNPGSYSACHYWVPSLYTCRAYHRPARLYDQAEWDGGGAYFSGPVCAPAPASSPQAPTNKVNSQK